MRVTVAKQVDVRANMKKYFDLAAAGETIMIPRKQNKNVVILSEMQFHAFETAKENAEYLAKLNRADEQIASGKVVVKTMDELEAMAE